MFKENLDFRKLDYIQNKVRFYLYKDDTPYKWNSINFPPTYTDKEYEEHNFILNTTNICFASLPRQLKDKNGTKRTDLNRMIFIFEKSKNINEIDQRKWLLLCKHNGFLPKYASVNNIIKNKAVVLDLTKHTLNMMYVYLSVCRFIQEDPCIVRNTLILVEKYKMDFFAALVFTTQIVANNMGHHFIPGSCPYMKPKSVDDLKDISLHYMVGLYRFIQKGGPHTYDTSSFNANDMISSLCKIKVQLQAADMLNPALPKIIRSDDAEIKQILTEEKINYVS